MSSATSLPFGVNDTAVRTTLASGITSTDTSVDVGEVTNPPSVPFLISVFVDQSPLREDEMEIMEVTSISGTTLTVNRGAKGTAAQSFSSGDLVFMGIVPSDVFDRDPAGIITSQSDIIAGNGSGNPSRIAGSTTQDDVLKINSSGNPTFGPSPAGGAWSKITTTNISSSVSSVDFTNGIDGTFDIHAIYYKSIDAGFNDELKMRFSNDGGSTFNSGSSAYGSMYLNLDDFTNNNKNVEEDSEIFVGPGSLDGGVSGIIYINDIYESTVLTTLFGMGISSNTNFNSSFSRFAGVYLTKEKNDAVRIFTNNNIQSGSISLYGINI